MANADDLQDVHDKLVERTELLIRGVVANEEKFDGTIPRELVSLMVFYNNIEEGGEVTREELQKQNEIYREIQK